MKKRVISILRFFENSGSEAVAQRIADIIDLKDRLVGILLGVHSVDLTHLPENTIIIAANSSRPLPRLWIQRMWQNRGGKRRGNLAYYYFARALEIPAVLSVKDALEKIGNGDTVIVDGEYGEVFVQPIPKTIEIYRKKNASYMKNRCRS